MLKWLTECRISNTSIEGTGRMTTSLGIAPIVIGESIGELFKRADIALYESRNDGRKHLGPEGLKARRYR